MDTQPEFFIHFEGTVKRRITRTVGLFLSPGAWDRMNYKDRNAKDRQILVGISQLSLPERFKRVRDLERNLKTAQADLDRKRAARSRTKTQETQLFADEDGIMELRCRLVLERSEYLALKEITPDYVEQAPREAD